VLMDVPVRLERWSREGIRGLTGGRARSKKEASLQTGLPREKNGERSPRRAWSEQIPLTDPMAQVSGASSYIYFKPASFPASPSPRRSGAVCDGLWMLADL